MFTYNLRQNLLRHSTKILVFALVLTDMLTVTNWKTIPPLPYMGGLIPVLFAVTPEMHMWAVRLKYLWTGGLGKGVTLFHLEEIVVCCEIKKILESVSTVLSGVVATLACFFWMFHLSRIHECLPGSTYIVCTLSPL